MSRIDNQTLALAGMFQAATLIEQLATSGELNSAAFDCSFDSLFTFEAPTAVEVFGDMSSLTLGFKTLATYLGGESESSGKNIAYYVLSMLKLARALQADKKAADQLQQSLRNIESRTSEFDMSRASMIGKIDGLYQDSISVLSPRIIVRGEQSYLTNSDNAARIRTLLLAGIRAAVLWQQLGGSKWKLVFLRKKYVATAQRYLAEN
jgi:high frequency lysogenization protein